MASHKNHYESGCGFGKLKAHGKPIGMEADDFRMADNRCAACEAKLLNEWIPEPSDAWKYADDALVNAIGNAI